MKYIFNSKKKGAEEGRQELKNEQMMYQNFVARKIHQKNDTNNFHQANNNQHGFAELFPLCGQEDPELQHISQPVFYPSPDLRGNSKRPKLEQQAKQEPTHENFDNFSFGDISPLEVLTEGQIQSDELKVAECRDTPSHSFHLHITHMAPNSSPAQHNTKVIVITTEIPMSHKWCAHFGECQVEMYPIAPFTFYFYTPRRNAGVATFTMQAVVQIPLNHNQPQTQPQTQAFSSQLLLSSPVPFFFTPSDERQWLSLAWMNLKAVPSDWVSMFRLSTRELDISNNLLKNLSFCDGLQRLKSLIADNNLLDGTSFPKIAKLRSLSLNKNRIGDLEAFLEASVAAFPILQRLSLLKNECCPFFADPSDYQQYRLRVISKFPHLIQLDSSPVTEEERNSSLFSFSPLEGNSTKNYPLLGISNFLNF